MVHTILTLLKERVKRWIDTATAEEILALPPAAILSINGEAHRRKTVANRARRVIHKVHHRASDEEISAVVTALAALKVGSKAYEETRDKLSRRFRLSRRQVAMIAKNSKTAKKAPAPKEPAKK